MPTTPETTVADVLRQVAVDLGKAWDDGHRSKQFDLDDMIEVLVTIADRLDPM